ncbi:AMP-binding protein [Dongia soli]|uniref:AMP-binding protein n=1 Tax=Dongia soli TaxID=600628 RepID=A0ABU5EGH1_9PROT|nr:AMP-binding protein [Dongia soli]MDY0885225.1 AMP-binding protein [Dongia soli]
MTAGSIARIFADGRAAAATVAATGGECIDLAQFHRDVAGNAAELRRNGCRQGLLACTDAYWTAVGLLSLFHAGATALMPQNVLPDTLMRIRDRWDHIVSNRPVAQDLPLLRLEHQPEQVGALPVLTAENCRLDLFTSGTTGNAKCVTKTLALLETEARAIESLFGPDLPATGWVHATVSPTHMYGLTFRLVWPLLTGRPFHGYSHDFWETVLAEDLHGAVLVTSPAHLSRLSGLPSQSEHNRPALILSAGSPLPASAAREATDILSLAPTEIFGSTETGAIAYRHWRNTDPAWHPLPGVAVRQQPDGCMQVRSPFIAGDGLYDSADLITLAADGSFRNRGRADDIVKIEGKRISLQEIEAALLGVDLVKAAAVIIMPSDRPRLAAAIVPSESGTTRLKEIGDFRFGRLLRQQLGRQLESACLPKHWRFVDALPASTLGKRRASDILALFNEENVTINPDRPQYPELRNLRPIGNGIELDLFIPSGLQQLDGHFPGLPIVPGVALVDWAAHYTAQYLHLGDGVASSLQVKFRRIMPPNREVTLTLKHLVNQNRMNFTYRHRDDVLTSGNFTLSP